MSEKKIIHIDVSSLDTMGQRFIDAWERVEHGVTVEPYYGASFESLETLLGTLTPRRWELLGHLRRLGPMTVYALAKSLNRDYKNVHGDVNALEELNLITRTADDKIEVPWDEIEAHIRLAA